MKKKITVGILGATGMVGQNYLSLLENHPWFNVTFLAASSRSSGKTYAEATRGRWLMENEPSKTILSQKVYEVSDIQQAKKTCSFVFSAFEIPDKNEIKRIESLYASSGIPVVSNASAHRWTEDVPILIPEINASHLDILTLQKKRLETEKGFIVVKPNCSIQSFMMPLDALMKAGYIPKDILITTLQATSGAGYPGVPSLDIIDNIVPYIGGEEQKTEKEPLKIFGNIEENRFKSLENITVSATCTRVPVTDGHTACVSVKFEGKPPSVEESLSLFKNYSSVPQELNLPSAPKRPIHVLHEENRPQPIKDRNRENGMAVSVGRVATCSVFDIKFVGLNHNTLRGAAGGGVLNGEILVAKGLIS